MTSQLERHCGTVGQQLGQQREHGCSQPKLMIGTSGVRIPRIRWMTFSDTIRMHGRTMMRCRVANLGSPDTTIRCLLLKCMATPTATIGTQVLPHNTVKATGPRAMQLHRMVVMVPRTTTKGIATPNLAAVGLRPSAETRRGALIASTS